MTTLSKLKQEGREELENIWDNFDDDGNHDTSIEEVETFLTAQIQKAYLSALSDVEKGLPKKVDLKDRFWGKSEVEYGFEHTHNNVLSAVKELINKLKESK